MAGEKDLRTLLATMSPQLNPGEYVYTVAPDGRVPAGVRPVVTVAEEEGLTLVVPRQDADRAGLAYDYVAGWITLRVHSALEAVGLTAAVAEEEGLTLVVPRQDADRAGLAYDYVAGWITLRVHSALEAVGLTAAVAEAMARNGISCNVVAGFHHDHLFVPHADAFRARDALEMLTR